MGVIVGYLTNPQTAPILVGVIALIVGFVALAVGAGPLALGAFGVFALCITAADVRIGIVTIPAGLVMLGAAVYWSSFGLHGLLGT